MRIGPILFSAPMVLATLDDEKSLTRRIVNPQPTPIPEDVWKSKQTPSERQYWWPWKRAGSMVEIRDMSGASPYGDAGDLLWVKESWRTVRALDRTKPRYLAEGAPIRYEADGRTSVFGHEDGPLHDSGRFRHSIFMRQWMARLWLKIEAVRVERLQDISESDCRAEGAQIGTLLVNGHDPVEPVASCPLATTYREAFCDIWGGIHGFQGAGSWDANPWVWVIQFHRVPKPENLTVTE